MDTQDPDYKEYQDYLAYLQHKGSQQAQAPAPAPAQEGINDKLIKYGQYGLKPFDYAGGLSRTAVSAAVQGGMNAAGRVKAAVTGDDYQPIDVVKEEDMLNALKGSAPSVTEYLKRAGVSEGASLSDALPQLYSDTGEGFSLKKGGMLDPTARGTVGTLADMALDPLTYMGMPGVRNALKATAAGSVIDKMAHPVETALSSGGKSLYKSAPIMQAADALNERYGKSAASDILLDHGIAGTGRQVATKAEDLAGAVGNQRDFLLKQGDKAGATLDMEKAMTPAQEMVDKIRASQDPNLQGAAEALQKKINEYRPLNPTQDVPWHQDIPTEILGKDGKPLFASPSDQKVGNFLQSPNGADVRAQRQWVDEGQKGISASQGSGFKSSLYNDTGNSTWDTLRKTPTGQKGTKALASGLDKETSAAVDRVLPGQGQRVDDLNNTWGALLTPRKTLENEALKGERKNFVTSVDGIIAGASHVDPLLLGSKKLTDLLKTNWLHTKLGAGMYNAGKDLSHMPGAENAVRRLLIDQSYKDPEKDSWLQMLKGQ